MGTSTSYPLRVKLTGITQSSSISHLVEIGPSRQGACTTFVLQLAVPWSRDAGTGGDDPLLVNECAPAPPWRRGLLVGVAKAPGKLCRVSSKPVSSEIRITSQRPHRKTEAELRLWALTDMANTEVGKAGSANSEELSPSSERKQPLDQKGEDEEPSPLESGGNSGKSSLEASPVRRGSSRQSRREAKNSRQTRSRHSSGGSRLEEKRSSSPPPARKRGRDKPESTRAKQHRARDSRHSKHPVKDRRAHPRSTGRTVQRRHRRDTLAAPPYNSLKRGRQHSPKACSSRSLSPLSRVITHVSALEVVLENLQVPGGAFLRVPSSSREPTVSQRAWLTWQLSHAGAALHWALYIVNYILAVQVWMPR
ncbi:serine/arginine repetitive matrix protein 2-like [Peromyscus eremicus]|uniref:serine/arginine repetitive matrix protein 2-like n=1 Tax=Peromyscus eremicus TaxID=42410 RepID=UPI0027DD31FD|nr:serine/arginine repetitive matrix protein 2-like [Peromyscus eremicus]